MNQIVPLKPIGCFLDYTYCANENCKNECGRKMSKSISKAISKMEWARVAYADFCRGDE